VQLGLSSPAAVQQAVPALFWTMLPLESPPKLRTPVWPGRAGSD
jgi:hypothetical protein